MDGDSNNHSYGNAKDGHGRSCYLCAKVLTQKKERKDICVFTIIFIIFFFKTLTSLHVLIVAVIQMTGSLQGLYWQGVH